MGQALAAPEDEIFRALADPRRPGDHPAGGPGRDGGGGHRPHLRRHPYRGEPAPHPAQVGSSAHRASGGHQAPLPGRRRRVDRVAAGLGRDLGLLARRGPTAGRAGSSRPAGHISRRGCRDDRRTAIPPSPACDRRSASERSWPAIAPTRSRSSRLGWRSGGRWCPSPSAGIGFVTWSWSRSPAVGSTRSGRTAAPPTGAGSSTGIRPRRFSMTWNATGTPTIVELEFRSLGPARTEVLLEHRGWEALERTRAR